jgi:hypothetical protein
VAGKVLFKQQKFCGSVCDKRGVFWGARVSSTVKKIAEFLSARPLSGREPAARPDFCYIIVWVA